MRLVIIFTIRKKQKSQTNRGQNQHICELRFVNILLKNPCPPPILNGYRLRRKYTGQPTTTQVEYSGKPSRMTITKRPADIGDINKMINVMLGKPDAQMWGWYDTNSDGVVDISDINAIINEMLGKTDYDVPTSHQGHDTEPRN